MILFVAPADQMWGIEEYLAQSGGALRGRLATLSYDDIVARGRLPLGTYVFGAIDQLTPPEMDLAARCGEELSRASPDVRLLNRPSRVLSRYDLLATCFARGRNTFGVRRASDFHRCRRFPVFVRTAREHEGSLTPLLHSRPELARALARALLQGHRLRDLIVVEYCHTADRSGVYRLYCAAIVGDRILPQALVHNRNWITKWEGRLLDADRAGEQLAYVEGNPHVDWLRETFARAGIGYGRIDYGLRDGVPQVWEINTNPTIVRRTGAPSAMTDEQWKMVAPAQDAFLRQFRAAWEAIDSDLDPGREVRIDVSPELRRRLEAATRRRARLRARNTVLARVARSPRRLRRMLSRAGSP